jgi:hypothetical protein
LHEAHDAFLKLGDDENAKAAEQLLQELLRRRVWQIIRYALYGIAALFGSITLFEQRQALYAVARRASHIVATPPRIAVSSYRHWEEWWRGAEAQHSPELLILGKERETVRRRLLFSFFMSMVGGALITDAVLITIPNLHYLANVRGTLAGWSADGILLRPDTTERMQSLLNYVEVSVVGSMLIQLAMLTIAIVASVFLYGIVEIIVDGGLSRFSRQPDGLPAEAFLVRLQRTELAHYRRFGYGMLMMLFAAGSAVGFDSVGLNASAIALAAIFAAFEVLRFVRASRMVRQLPPSQQFGTFNWMHQTARGGVLTFTIDILIFSYGLLPTFYFVGREAQRSLILPLFERASNQFNALTFEVVHKYGYFILDANIATVFVRMREAYDPGSGAEQLWADFLIPILPYLFLTWALVILTRLFLPLASSFDGWRGAWKTFRVSVIVALAGTAFQRAAVHLFHLDDHSASIWILLIVVGLLFSLYLRQSVQPTVKCPVASCGANNAGNAKYCSQCGVGLPPISSA